jgi:hypothetical protein
VQHNATAQKTAYGAATHSSSSSAHVFLAEFIHSLSLANIIMSQPRGLSDATVSLLDKYDSLKKGIDQTLAQRAVVDAETEKIQEQMLKLQDENERLQHGTTLAHQEVLGFHTQLDQANKKYSVVEQEHTQAFLAKDRATQERECFQQFCGENRQVFLEQSREFRSNCKRMRLRACVLGLEHASIRAFTIVKGADESIYDQLVPAVLLASDDTSQDDPDSWEVNSDDEEMKEQLVAYQKKKQDFRVAKEHFETYKAHKEHQMEKAASCQDRKDKLQTQVDKICNDNEGLKKTIQDQEFLTQEAKSMAEGYSKSMYEESECIVVLWAAREKLTDPVSRFATSSCFPDTARLKRQKGYQKKTIVTPSPVVRSISQGLPDNTRNPYARSSAVAKTLSTASATHPSTCSSSSSNMSKLPNSRRRELQKVDLGSAVAATARSAASISTSKTCALERQHPHRTTRIRDRQFGSSLQVTGDDLFSTMSPNDITKNTFSPPSISTIGASFSRIVQALENDDDDEDEEALFSYSAFSN